MSLQRFSLRLIGRTSPQRRSAHRESKASLCALRRRGASLARRDAWAALLVIFSLLLAALPPGAARAAGGAVDSGFDPGAGQRRTVFSIVVQPDGKVLVGGSLPMNAGVGYNGVERLNADGSLEHQLRLWEWGK